MINLSHILTSLDVFRHNEKDDIWVFIRNNLKLEGKAAAGTDYEYLEITIPNSSEHFRKPNFKKLKINNSSEQRRNRYAYMQSDNNNMEEAIQLEKVNHSKTKIGDVKSKIEDHELHKTNLSEQHSR